MTDENSRFDKVDERARAIIAVTLLEQAMHVLVAASREAPRQMHIDAHIVKLNRQIEQVQALLLPIADRVTP